MASPPEQPPPQPMDDSPANNLILTLRQVSISPSAADKQRTFSLREFEILQTIGELREGGRERGPLLRCEDMRLG